MKKKVLFSVSLMLLFASVGVGFSKSIENTIDDACVPVTLSCGIQTIICGDTNGDIITEVIDSDEVFCAE